MLSSGASQLQRSWQTPFVASCAQVDWKLTRGKWRPKLLDYAKSHSETTVRAATSAAFDIISSTQSAQADLKAAMGSLTELKVGLPVLSSASTFSPQKSVHIARFTRVAAYSQGPQPYKWESGSLITEARQAIMQSTCSPIAPCWNSILITSQHKEVYTRQMISHDGHSINNSTCTSCSGIFSVLLMSDKAMVAARDGVLACYNFHCISVQTERMCCGRA